VAILAFSCQPKTGGENEARSSVQGPATLDAKSILSTANRYYQNDEFERAVVGFRRVIRLDTTSGEAFYKLAYSLAMTKKTLYDEAIQNDVAITEASLEQKDTSVLSIINNFISAAELGYRIDEAYYSAAVYASTIYLDDSLALKLFNKSLEHNLNQPEVYQMMDDIKLRLRSEGGR
jgi:tetratricopeptide (TPR) repeat protein